MAIVIQILLDDSGGGNPLSPAGLFDDAVANVVNEMHPGSVQPAGASSNMTNFKNADAEELFKKTRQQAIKALIGQITERVTESGYQDGLTGSKQEPSSRFRI